MIISHKHKFIFIKTEKTAGTSLEIALSKFCGPEDIITPISDEDEITRQHRQFPGPQNYNFPNSFWLLRTRLLEGQNPQKFWNHIPASAVKRKVDETTWNSYFKFSVIRDPVERIISFYYWAKNANQDVIDFPEFLRKYASKIFRNYYILTEKDELVLDFHICFERFEYDLSVVEKRLDIPERLYSVFNDIKAKAGYRPRSSSSCDVIGDKEREIIRYIVRDEIQLLGYFQNDVQSVPPM